MTVRNVPLRRLVKILNGGTPTSDPVNWDGGVPWATPVDVGRANGAYLEHTLRTLTPQGAKSGSAMAPSQCVIVSTRAPIGYVATNTVPMAFNQGCKALLPNPTIHPSFLRYALAHANPEMQSLGQGSTFLELSSSALAGVSIPYQSLDKQKLTVDFLDRETAQIDRLIVRQERLIELLAEKRQAIVTQAVTRGLDPSAPTKPSGIPWVPASPIHWAASRIKWTHPKQESGTSVNGTDVPAGSGHIGVLKTGAVSKGYFLASSNKTVVPEDVDRATCPVRGGTLIVNRANTPDLVGSTGAPETDMPTLFLSDKLWQIDFKDANTRFMYWWTKTDGYRSQIQFRRVGASSSMQNLSYSDFLTIDLAVPPLSEQEEIAQYLDGRTKQLDVLAFKARQAIALLRERRSALISAAVTGKIDVREMAA
ncbi:restriction endonuclease subunit S [Arthrobacter sp. 7Tela_A1]|uniref:restriction endonuclease subunit S n=1 Tax=Arthrobacter sp. 7Tela_A1 TaxID=3093745 RepID=UPI003BB6C95E